MREPSITLRAGELFAGARAVALKHRGYVLCSACPADVEVVITVLCFERGIDKNVPHPATFEVVAYSLPHLCVFVIDIIL